MNNSLFHLLRNSLFIKPTMSFNKQMAMLLVSTLLVSTQKLSAQVGGNTCAAALANLMTIGVTANAQTTCGKANDDATYNGQDFIHCFQANADGCVNMNLNFRPGDYTKNAEAVITVRNGCGGAIVSQGNLQIGPNTNYVFGPTLDYIVQAGAYYYITIDVIDYGTAFSDCIEYELFSSFATAVLQVPGGNDAAAAGLAQVFLGAPYLNQTTCCVGNNYLGTPFQNDWFYKYHADSSGCLTFAMNNMRTDVNGKTSTGLLIVADAMAGNNPTSVISNNTLSIPDGINTAANSDSFFMKVQAGKDYYFLVSSTSANNSSTAICFNYDFQLVSFIQNKPTLGGNSCAAAALAPLVFDNTYTNQNICCMDGYGPTDDKWIYKLDNITFNCLNITQTTASPYFPMQVHQGCPQGNSTLLFDNTNYWPVRASFNFLGDSTKDYYVVISPTYPWDREYCRPFGIQLNTEPLNVTQPGGPTVPYSDTAEQIVMDSLYTNQSTCCTDVWYYRFCPTKSGCAVLNISNVNFTYPINTATGAPIYPMNWSMTNVPLTTISYYDNKANYQTGDVLDSMKFDYEAGKCYYFRIEGECMTYDFKITSLDTMYRNPVGDTSELVSCLKPIILDSVYVQHTTCCVGDRNNPSARSQEYYYCYCATKDECLNFEIFNINGIQQGENLFVDITGQSGNIPKFFFNFPVDSIYAHTPKFDVDSGDCIKIRYRYEGKRGCANFDFRLNYDGQPGNPIGGKNTAEACLKPMVLDSLYANHTTCCASDVSNYRRTQEWLYCYCATQSECLRFELSNLTGMLPTEAFIVTGTSVNTGTQKFSMYFPNNTAFEKTPLFSLDAGDCISIKCQHIGDTGCVNFDLKLVYNGIAYQAPGGVTPTVAQSMPVQLNTPYYHTTCCFANFYYAITPPATGCLNIILDSITAQDTLTAGVYIVNYNGVTYDSFYNNLTTTLQVDSGSTYYFHFQGSAVCSDYKLTFTLDTGSNNLTIGSTNYIAYASTPLYNMSTDSIYLNQGSCCNPGFRSYSIIAPDEGCITPQLLNVVHTNPPASNLSPISYFAGNYITNGILYPNFTFGAIAVDSAGWYPNFLAFNYTNEGCTNFDVAALFTPIQEPGSYTASKAVNKPITLGQQYGVHSNCQACNNGYYYGNNSCAGFYNGTDWTYFIKPQTTGTIKITLNDILRTDNSYAQHVTLAIYNAPPGTPDAQVASVSKIILPAGAAMDSMFLPLFVQASTDSFYIVVDAENNGMCFNYKIRTEKVSDALPCNNSDFENGNLNGWTPSYGNSTQGCNVCSCPAPYYACPAFETDTARHRITSGGLDYYGGFPKVYNGAHSFQLGNSSTNGEAEGIKQSFLVTPANAFFEYSYAVVFEDPGHQPQTQPFFRARLKDSANNLIQCTQFCVSATGNIPGFLPSPQSSGVSVYYKPWSTVGLDLSAYIGTIVTVEFENGDCADGGHFGYSYIDCVCKPSPTTASDTICDGSCDSLFGPQGYMLYDWQPGGFTTTNIKVCPTATTTYTLNYTTYNGCVGQTEYKVEVPTPFTLTDSTNCFNGGTIIVFANGIVNNNLIYTWSNSAFGNNAIVTNVSNGTYTVTATDGFCYTQTKTVTMNFTYPIINSATSTNITCNGLANGAININATCTGGCTYLLNNTSVASAIFTGLNVGVYTVQITASNGCFVTNVDTITQPDSLKASVTGWSGCDSSALLPASIAISGGTLPYNYLWSNGSVNANPNLPIGPGTFLLTDSNGCFVSDTFINNAQGTRITVFNPIICAGQSFLGYNLSGTYTDTFTLSTTCDSVRIINLTVNPTYYDTSKVTVCFGTVYQGQTTSGTYVTPYQTINGCDSLKVLVLNVIPLITNNIAHTMCAGDSFLGYTTTGIYKDTFISFITGCDSIRTITLTVNPLPNVIANVLPNNLNVCDGKSITLYGSGAATYNWNNGVIDNSIFTPNATNTYTVTGTSAAGCVSTSAITITVLPLPTVTATTQPDPAIICAGDSVKLVATSTSPIAWSGGIANNTFFKPNVSNVYTVTATASNGCTSTSTVNVTVNPLPPVAITAAPNTALCIGESVALSANGALTYVWNGSVVDGVAFSPTSTATYTVTGTDGNGCTKSATKTIVVNPLPIVNALAIPSNGIICTGKPITLYGGGASTYAWTGGITNNVAFTPTANGNYTVTGTDANGCVSTSSISISLLPLPIIVITSQPTPAEICNGDSIKLIASGATSYSWTSGIVNDVYFNPTTSATYTVTATGANGCTTTATKFVKVNPLPNIVVTANPSFSICIGKSVSLTASAGATYVWSSGINNGVSFMPPSTATYTVTATNNFGCISSTTRIVTVNPLPIITTSSLPSPPVICATQTLTLIGNGALTYSWTGGITNNVPFVLNASDTYTVTGTDANGCTSTSSISVTANPLPIITINAVPTNATMCQFDSVYLIAAGAPTLVWNNGMTNGSYVYPNTTTTYTVTGTNAYGCTSIKTVTVNVLPVVTTLDTIHLCEGVIKFFEGVLIPTAGTYNITLQSSYGCDSFIVLTAIEHVQPIGKIDGPTNMCVGDTITLRASTIEIGTDYAWYLPSATLIAQKDNSVDISYAKAGDYEINLTITPPAPCVPRTAYDTIHVHEVKAQITSSSLQAVICDGAMVTLASYWDENYKFKWLLASSIYDTTRQIRIKPNGKVLVILQVQDQWNCMDEDSITLKGEACCNIFMPNAFTPNDDKLNDGIYPLLDYSTELNEYSVFNRWGEKVFSTTQKEIKWDGYYKGVPCDLDTYYFIVRYTCRGELKIEKGEFQLIR
jgi:gliding motility-associated-like protein